MRHNFVRLFRVILYTVLFTAPSLTAVCADLTIVADEFQINSMSALFEDLKEANVEVAILPPTEINKAKNEDYLIVVITAAQSDPIFSAYGKELLSSSDLKRIQSSGGKKLIVLRDTWKNGQEIVCFAGNTAEDAKSVRIETKDRWWEIVGGWFDIYTGGMKGY